MTEGEKEGSDNRAALVGCLIVLVVIGGIVGIVVVLSGNGEDDPADASARLACPHFRNIVGDAEAGIITDAELREKLQEVHRSASISEVDGLPEASRDMLAGATQGDTDLMTDGVRRMSSACRSVGL